MQISIMLHNTSVVAALNVGSQLDFQSTAGRHTLAPLV